MPMLIQFWAFSGCTAILYDEFVLLPEIGQKIALEAHIPLYLRGKSISHPPFFTDSPHAASIDARQHLARFALARTG